MNVAEDPPRIHGKTLYSNENDKVGEIDDVFLDDQTGKPEWVRISVGLLGMKNVLVPAESLHPQDDGLKSPYSKDMIKDAPRVDDDYVSPEQETTLYRYYGIGGISPSELNEKRGRPDAPMEQGPPATPAAGEPPAYDAHNRPVMPEESTLPRREGPPSRVRLRRWFET